MRTFRSPELQERVDSTTESLLKSIPAKQLRYLDVDMSGALRRLLFIRAMSHISVGPPSIRTLPEWCFWRAVLIVNEARVRAPMRPFAVFLIFLIRRHRRKSSIGSGALENTLLQMSIVASTEHGHRFLIYIKEKKHQRYVMDALVSTGVSFQPASIMESVALGKSQTKLNPRNRKSTGLESEVELLKSVVSMFELRGILVVEGDSDIDVLASEVAAAMGIPSFCLQWGGFSGARLKPGFRRLGYSYFFAWGPLSSSQIVVENPNLIVNDIGYLSSFPSAVPSRTILFCSQVIATGFVSSEDCADFQLLAAEIARALPEWSVIWRPHPSDRTHTSAEHPLGTKLSRNLSLLEDLRTSSIVVAIASSALLEALAMGVVAVAMRKEEQPLLVPDPYGVSDSIIRGSAAYLTEIIPQLAMDNAALQLQRAVVARSRKPIIVRSGKAAVKTLMQILDKSMGAKP